MEAIAIAFSVALIGLMVLYMFDTLAWLTDGPPKRRVKTPKVDTTLADISARRTQAIENAHDAWDGWWVAIAREPAPVRESKKKVAVSGTNRGSYSYKEVRGALHSRDPRKPDPITRKLHVVLSSMSDDGYFTPSVNESDLRFALEIHRNKVRLVRSVSYPLYFGKVTDEGAHEKGMYWK